MTVIKGKNVVIKEGTIIGDNVVIEDDVYIDYNCIIRDNVTIKKGTTIGAQCILGEFQMDFYNNRDEHIPHPLIIGESSIIRSGTIIYGDTTIGDYFQTGHRATIREHTRIGNHVNVGTLSDIQGYCDIGNYVKMHSNVHIGQKSVIEDFVWIFPYVVLTNDPTPPSGELVGVTVKSFSIIATGSIVMPGLTIEGDSLVAAGAVVTKNVNKEDVVAGVPGKTISNICNIKNHVTGEPAYPWRYHFDRGMPWENSDYETWEKAQK